MKSTTKDMTQGNVMKLLVGFFLPLFAGNLFQQFYGMVDSIVVGKGIGDRALAAVGNTGSVHWLIFGFAIGLTSGMGIHLAQSFGAGNMQKLRREVAMSVVACTLVSVVITTVSLLMLRQIFTWLHTPEDMLTDTLDYFRMILIGCGASIFNNLAMTLLRSVGNSRVPLMAMISSAIVNIALDLLFVFPMHMGVFGAALATVLAQVFSALFCLFFIRKVDALIPHREDWHLRFPVLGYLFGQGLPVAFMNGITSIGGLVLQYFVNSMGTVFVAAHSACMKLCGMFEQPGVAVGISVMTFVGQNFGAKNFDRIKKGILNGILLSSIANIPVALVQILIPTQMTSLMLSDPQIIAMTPQFLHITAFAFYGLGLLFVVRYAQQAMGHTFVPMLSGVLEVLMRVGCAWLFIESLGMRGVALCEISAWIGAAIMLAITCKYYYDKEKKKYGQLLKTNSITE